MNKRLLTGGLAALLALGGGFYWSRHAASGPAVHYTTTPADRGHVQSRVTATGTLSALVTVQVGSQVSGRISALYADYNDQVKKGQVLARLDPQLFEASLAQARANAVAAESSLTRARIQAAESARALSRARQLSERQLIARAELDTAQANADSARAQVAAAEAGLAQAKAQVHQAQLNLNYTTIRSPIDGTVIARAVDVGQTVAASLQAPTLFEIAQDLREAQVDAAVSEADVGKLKSGMKAEFTVAAFPAEHFVGTVRQVRNAPETTSNVVTYDAVIDVENPELKLRPGMTANVSFVYADRENALRVPNAALRFQPPAAALAERHTRAGAAEASDAPPRRERMAKDPASRRVWVLEAGKPHPVRVKIGITDGSFTEIVSGDLAEGAQLITDATGGTAAAGSDSSRRGFRRGGRMF